MKIREGFDSGVTISKAAAESGLVQCRSDDLLKARESARAVNKSLEFTQLATLEARAARLQRTLHPAGVESQKPSGSEKG
jgi:hypothetical protein